VGHKKSQVIFACNCVNNQHSLFNEVFDVRFKNELHMLCYELHPPHLINAATLLKTLKM